MNTKLNTSLLPASFLMALAVDRPVAAQDYLYSVGPTFQSGAGLAVASLPDVDGDGAGDFAATSSEDVNGIYPGTVRLFSGADGTVLHAWSGTSDKQQFGHRLADVGDVDGDGVSDLAVSSLFHTDWRTGSVDIYSGRTYQHIRHHADPETNTRFGFRVGGMGDVDQDGRDDYLVVASYGSGTVPGDFAGALYVYSGRTGTPISRGSSLQNNQIGDEMAILDDVDGDGVRDLAVSGAITGYEVRSGATLNVLHSQKLNGQVSLAALGDVDGDGAGDFVTGWGNQWDPTNTYRGLIQGRSGATGAELWRFWNEPGPHYLPTAMARAGDVDGDGQDELLVAASSYRPNGSHVGLVYVVRGSDGFKMAAWSAQTGSALGTTVAGLPDVNGDGFEDLLIGSQGAGTRKRQVSAISFGAVGRPAWSQRIGAPCAGSDGALPRIHRQGELRLGSSCDLLLQTGLPGAPTVLALAAPLNVAGAAYGAPGCTLYAAGDGFNIMRSVDASGHASAGPIPVPNDTSLSGAVLRAQWLTFDPSANPLGTSFSDALEMRFGT